MSDPVIVRLDLSEVQALALAQPVKRFHHSDAPDRAVDDAEADRMIAAVIALQRAPDGAGYSPR